MTKKCCPYPSQNFFGYEPFSLLEEIYKLPAMDVSQQPVDNDKRKLSAQKRQSWGRAVLAIQVLSICALIVPTTANAALMTVNSTSDEPDFVPGVGSCLTATNTCTLRAAIEEANLKSDWDTINFDTSVFNGEIADTIEPATELPAIANPTTIADLCPPNQYNDIPRRPCVGVDAGGGATGFRVESDDVAIEGISITGATIGIEVIGSSDDFVARRDWIGADLNQDPGPNSTGIFFGSGANDARVGGYIDGSAGGNLIVNNSAVGLDLDGASRSWVAGNEFGLIGHTAAPNGKGIEITDHSTGDSVVRAVENEIGSEIFHFGELSTYCDEGCNVISGAVSSGIDLQGDGGNELPATGPTTIRSNFIGTDWSGEEAVPNGYAGIVVGDADQVMIGGSREKDSNLITGGLWGVLAGSESRELTIESNDVGRASGGYRIIDPPTQGAFSIDSSAITYSEAIALIAANVITLDEGVAISNYGHGALILENQIYGGDVGIRAFGENGWWFGAISGNEIESPAAYGILVESSKNRVLGNAVFAAGEAGIRVDSASLWPPSEVSIGGDEEEDENLVEYSGGPAVEIVGSETSFVDVARNFGAGNAGPFIDLGADGVGNQLGGPNGGIQAPSINVATVNGVSGGGAEPGATIRVFVKSDSSPGELEEFLASAGGQEDGKWSVAYPTPLPIGTPIGVSQTGFHGTSELTLASTIATGGVGGAIGGSVQQELPSAPPGEASCANASESGCSSATQIPDTRIVTGPSRQQPRTIATFKFVTPLPGSRMQCSLDGKPFYKCKSPKTYTGLEPGKHVFRVRAVGPTGLIDTTPAEKRFSVLPAKFKGRRL